MVATVNHVVENRVSLARAPSQGTSQIKQPPQPMATSAVKYLRISTPQISSLQAFFCSDLNAIEIGRKLESKMSEDGVHSEVHSSLSTNYIGKTTMRGENQMDSLPAIPESRNEGMDTFIGSSPLSSELIHA
jgi:hypothetical protein